MYKVSIIMPIFNAEKYIERSFQSILNQTMNLDDIEVIMVDDKSTDKTRSIVEKYEREYPNFKGEYHEINSGGCAIPRNSGLNVASGEYVMFLDPDDEYAPDMCERLYKRIKDSDAQVVKCNHKMINPDAPYIAYELDKNIKEKTLSCKTDFPPITSSVCNAIHDRTFLNENDLNFANLRNAEDVLFSIQEFFNADKIILMNDYAGYYYYTNETVSHARTPTAYNLDALLKSYNMTKSVIEKEGRTEIMHRFFSKRCAPFMLLLLDFPGDKKEYLKRFYDFEKSLDEPLNFQHSWMNITNRFLVKNQFSKAVLTLNIFSAIRKTPVNKIYRKLL